LAGCDPSNPDERLAKIADAAKQNVVRTAANMDRKDLLHGISEPKTLIWKAGSDEGEDLSKD
jgi:hypothetical protein